MKKIYLVAIILIAIFLGFLGIFGKLVEIISVLIVGGYALITWWAQILPRIKDMGDEEWDD